MEERNNAKETSFSTGKYDLHRDFVDDEFHDSYIITGYRKPNITAMECIKSAFVFSCNESFNILSHYAAFIYLLVKYYRVFTVELSMDNPLHWPMLCQAVGVLGFCFMSATAHMFNAMSSTARNRCFFLDYAAISVYSVGAGVAFYFYERPLNSYSVSIGSPLMFISISIATSIISTWLCCQSRTKWTSIKYIVRTLSYVLAFVVNSYPYFYRLLTCDNEADCDTTTYHIYHKHAMLQLLAAIANVTKFPERFIPAKFDALGQSHHIMHILFPYACDIKFEFLKAEFAQKKTLLEQNAIQPEIFNTLGVMGISILLNLAIALFSDASSKKKDKVN